MTRRQSNNQWSGGIAAHPDTNIPSAKLCWKILTWIFRDQDGNLLIVCLTKAQTINADYYPPLLLQLKDILKEKRRGNTTSVFLFLNESAPAPRALPSQKKLALWAANVLITHPVLRICPCRTTTCSMD